VVISITKNGIAALGWGSDFQAKKAKTMGTSQ
jgi:hypothetical protein